METLINIAIFIIGGVLGYHFCKMRYRVNDLLDIISLYTDMLKENITREEFTERFHKIYRK